MVDSFNDDEETIKSIKEFGGGRSRIPYVYMSRSPSFEDGNNSRIITPSPGLLADFSGAFGMRNNGIKSISSSRRTSIQSTNETNSENVQSKIINKQNRKKDGKIFEFAKLKNPTLSIKLSKEFSFDFTYAELLQFTTILLTIRKLFNYFSSIDTSHSNFSSFETLQSTPKIIYLNFVVFLIASATIEGRKRAEQLGLRRTCLILCTILFLFGFIFSIWPIDSTKSTNQIDSNSSLQMQGSLSTMETLSKSQVEEVEVKHCFGSEFNKNLDCHKAQLTNSDQTITTLRSISQTQCSSIKMNDNKPSFIHIQTDPDHSIMIFCSDL